MQFRVGSITARCAKCECTVFERAGTRVGERPQSTFSCRECKTEVSYSELILQIGKESAKRTRERRAITRQGVAPEPAAAALIQRAPASLRR